MAAEFLASYGINLDEEVTLAYHATLASHGNGLEEREVDFAPPSVTPVRFISNIQIGSNQTIQSIIINAQGQIAAITPEPSPASTKLSALTRLALPSLAHPHIHLDKPYLLSHKDTSHLQPETGTFEEALGLTAEAKPLYTVNALLERGAQLLAESARAGVTHLRGFCEVDTAVALKCVTAGVELKKAWERCVHVQIAAFAQDPLFSTKVNGTGLSKEDLPQKYIPEGNKNLELLQQALEVHGVEVLATTPYVEASSDASKRNVDWAIDTAIKHDLHLDFHLDYNLDPEQEPLIWYVLDRLRKHRWPETQRKGKTVCIGHCTRLTLFSPHEWERLAEEVADLPVYFIGLPTSDLFMQGRANVAETVSEAVAASHNRLRSTLHVPSLIQLGLKAAIGVNNIGNAFTPFGSADPLHVAKWCIGIYQSGTAEAARVLYECVSYRAKEAMGIFSSSQVSRLVGTENVLVEAEEANLIVFGPQDQSKRFVHQRHSMEEVVCNPPSENERMVIYKGNNIVI